MYAMQRLEGRTLFASYSAATVAELIAAINAANASNHADTITLAAGATFSLTARTSTANGGTGLPVIAAHSGDLTILGNGDTIKRIEAPHTLGFRLFDVAAGASLTLKNLTLEGGSPIGVMTGVSRLGQGGAIHNQGELILEGVTIQNNTVLGLAGWGGTPPGQALGGAVYSSGTLTITGCTIQSNFAIGGPTVDAFGGGIYIGGGTVSINSSAVTSNTAQGGEGGSGDGFGGGLYAAGGSVALHDVTIATNAAAGGRGYQGSSGQGIGGGIYIAPAASVGLDQFTLDHCRRNKASTSAKDIFGSFTLI